MEKKFTLDPVSYVATGEYLSSENDLKDELKDWSDHSILRNVAEVLKECNGLVEALARGELNLLPFSVLMKEANILREHLPYGVDTMRIFDFDIEDEIGIMHKVIFQGKVEIEELPAPKLLEAYRTHCKETLGRDELTVLTVKRHLAFYQQRTGSPSPDSSIEGYEAYLKTLDPTKDIPMVSEFIAAMVKTAENFAGKFGDVAETMRIQILRELPDIKAEWDKRAADPFTSPTGLIVGEQTADTRLLAELQDLAKEAYATAQRMESKKRESFFTLLKNLLPKRHEGILLTSEDAKKAI